MGVVQRGCVHRFATSSLHELQTRNAHGRPILLEKAFEGPQCTGHWSYQWEAFFRAVRGETVAPSVTPQQIVAGIRVLEAIARSERSNAPERVLDPLEEPFSNPEVPPVHVGLAASPVAEVSI